MSVTDDLNSENLFGDPEILDERDDEDRQLFLENEADEQNVDTEENDHILQTVPQSDNPVAPKQKRVVRNPQPKLNPERLKGPRGLAVLGDVFKDYRFCGKGYEKRDLDQVMKRLEHWAHRLFPKYQFDDCLEKLEILGHKKPVMVYVKKIRMGLETIESSEIEPATEVNEEDLALPLDPFDELLGQQLSEAHASLAVLETPQNHVARSPPRPKITLTEEQRERMERNRLIAQERRLARMKALQEKQAQPQTEISVPNDSQVFPTNEVEHYNVIEGDNRKAPGDENTENPSREDEVLEVNNQTEESVVGISEK